MTMSDEAQREYNEALLAAALKHGTPVAIKGDTFYGWQDFDLYDHLTSCPVLSTGRVDEDYWDEFKGTFYEGDTSVHGIVVKDVTCRCGKLDKRQIRWAASVSEVAEAVFEQAFGQRRR